MLNLGIDGLAYATLVTKIIEGLFIVWLYHRKTHDFAIGWRIKSAFDARAIIVHLLKVGTPLSFSQASTHFGFLLINVLIAPFGYEVVAAFAIGNRINSLMFSPTRVIGQGVVPLIAQNWGAGAMGRVRKSINVGLQYSLICGVLGSGFIYFVKHPLGGFLTNGDDTILYHTLNYVGLVGWTVIPWSVFQMLQSIFESFQKTTFTVWINLFRLWGVRIPGVLLASYYLPSLAEYGVWYTMFLFKHFDVDLCPYLFCNPYPKFIKWERCSSPGRGQLIPVLFKYPIHRGVKCPKKNLLMRLKR